MKIAIIASDVVPSKPSGMNSLIINMGKELRKLGNDITIITSVYYKEIPAKSDVKKLESKHLKIHIVPFYFPKKILSNYIPQAIQATINMISITLKLNKKFNFDIIHTHSASPLFSIIGQIIKKILKKPVIHSLHGLSSSKIGELPFIYRSLKSFNKVIVTTKYQHKKLIKNKVNAIRIPNGINTTKFKSLPIYKKRKIIKKYNLQPNFPIIGFIGPLEKRKGFHNFLKISKEIAVLNKKVNFIIMNSTSEKFIKKDLKSNIKKRFIFTGPINNPTEIINCMDVVIFPFDYINITLGQPLALLEAMACSKAVIVSNVKGIKEIITNKKNGLIYNHKKIKELQTLILDTLKNKEKIKKLGILARKTTNKYNNQKITKDIYNIYKEELKNE